MPGRAGPKFLTSPAGLTGPGLDFQARLGPPGLAGSDIFCTYKSCHNRVKISKFSKCVKLVKCVLQRIVVAFTENGFLEKPKIITMIKTLLCVSQCVCPGLAQEPLMPQRCANIQKLTKIRVN